MTIIARVKAPLQRKGKSQRIWADMKDTVKGSLSALASETLYGLSYIFTKDATASASWTALLGWRFLIAALAMSLCVATGIVRIDLRGKKIRPLLLVASLNPCIYFIAETVGISHTTASESGVILACIPVASLIASALILHERPGKLQTAGIAITLSGVITTTLVLGGGASISAVGYASLMIAVVSYALYSVSVEKASGYTDSEITYAMLIAGAILFPLIAIAEGSAEGNIMGLLLLPIHDPGFLIAILYQGIGCSIAAFFLANKALSLIGVNRTSSFIGVATLVSIVAGAALLGEPFTTGQAIGAALIIAGVYTANAGRTR